MRIDEIALRNFRGFEEFAVRLHPKLTVFVGNNGSGKSAILDALAIAAGTFFSGLDGVPSNGIAREDVTCKSFHLGTVIDLQHQYPAVIAVRGEIDGESLTWSRSLNSPAGRTTTINAKSIISVAEHYLKRIRQGDTSAILPVISYYGTGRLWAQKKEKRALEQLAQFNRLSGYTDCLAAESNEKLMLKWFEKMTIQQAQQGKISPELNAARQAIACCFAGITGADDVDIQFNLDTHSLDVLYTSATGQHSRMPMKNLSDGYRNTLGMIADIAYRMAILNPQLLGDVLQKTPGIILIDEVDLHLHPRWQQRIIGDLQAVFPQVQFIVSTHAPAVISSVRQDNLRILSGEKQSSTVPAEVYGKDANSILTGVMDASPRPAEIQSLFGRFYQAIDSGELEKAARTLDEIEYLIGAEDPELAGARVSLALEQI